jgi:hypothetical protein
VRLLQLGSIGSRSRDPTTRFSCLARNPGHRWFLAFALAVLGGLRAAFDLRAQTSSATSGTQTTVQPAAPVTPLARHVPRDKLIFYKDLARPEGSFVPVITALIDPYAAPAKPKMKTTEFFDQLRSAKPLPGPSGFAGAAQPPAGAAAHRSAAGAGPDGPPPDPRRPGRGGRIRGAREPD